MKLIPLGLMITFAAFVINGSFAGPPLSNTAYNALPQMSAEFLGEPNTIGQMRIGDRYWVPAHTLSVDMYAKCWLDPECKLDEKSDHLIQVNRFKETTITRGTTRETVIGYAVSIDKKKLQGWRWKLTEVNKDELIPVQVLSIY